MQDEYLKDNAYGLEGESDFHATRALTTISIIQDYANNKSLERILDVGCGIGIITKMLAKSFPTAKIDAIDISEEAIKKANLESQGIDFTHADGMVYKGKNELYDVILLNNIYEHIENPTGMLMNLKKLLTDTGIIVISTPNRYFIRNVIRKLLGLNIAIPRYHITEYSIGQMYDHHKYVGLKINIIKTPGFKREKFRFIDFVLYKIIKPIVDLYLLMVRSRNKMGSLLFIVSSKINN